MSSIAVDSARNSALPDFPGVPDPRRLAISLGRAGRVCDGDRFDQLIPQNVRFAASAGQGPNKVTVTGPAGP